jgi:pimeloyl-ACP methyl ester carboxylesterase
MRFLRSPWGAFLLVVAAALAVLLGMTSARVYAKTHPQSHSAPPIDFESVMLRVEPVSFPAADGVPLRGWLLPGQPGRPPVVLCHDLGESKSSLVGSAIALRMAGFTVLLFDFRGHGESAGNGSTLGLHEKRDVLGAVEFLKGIEGLDTSRVGLFGIGMGAHAAVLAAAELPEVRVLVLDGLYPDPAFPLVRDVYGEWNFAARYLGFVPRLAYTVLSGSSPRAQRAADVIGRLPGRHLLLLAPAGDSALAEQMQLMYGSIPDQQDADGNLVVLPATHTGGLYGDQLVRYQERVTGFFLGRLGEGQG